MESILKLFFIFIYLFILILKCPTGLSCEVAQRNWTAKRMENYESGKEKKKHVVFISYCRISFLKIFFILVLLLIFAVVLLFFFCPKYVVKKQNRVYVEKYRALLTFKFWKQNGLWVWLTQNSQAVSFIDSYKIEGKMQQIIRTIFSTQQIMRREKFFPSFGAAPCNWITARRSKCPPSGHKSVLIWRTGNRQD